ncbi:hypothetical protein HYFRA_00006162 [Hymenoscyphus fraxineus]|uniref:Uncharacterized protein n=1 Tax=Hymenoscyphus fraxineus TaxID=746836 RepID=A0A9N9PP57_9HELO|nr:hypothetical protein HYFRA_00006162 [Hymenoscyphus fraxineus]
MGMEQIAAPVQPNAAKLPILVNASFLSKAIILCYSSNGNGTPSCIEIRQKIAMQTFFSKPIDSSNKSQLLHIIIAWCRPPGSVHTL